MFYTVYKIINNITGREYIGVHRTTNPHDNYMGSGSVIKKAIKKHGVQNFTKEIISIFDNEIDMLTLEADLVNEDWVNDPTTYNVALGGEDPIAYINKCGKNLYGQNGDSTHGGQNLSTGADAKQRLIEQGRWEEHLEKRRIASRRRFDDGFMSSFSNTNPLHTEEGKRKQKESFERIKHQQGSTNSQFGTRWITNGTLNQKIKRTDAIPDGWKSGRICTKTD